MKLIISVVAVEVDAFKRTAFWVTDNFAKEQRSLTLLHCAIPQIGMVQRLLFNRFAYSVETSRVGILLVCWLACTGLNQLSRWEVVLMLHHLLILELVKKEHFGFERLRRKIPAVCFASFVAGVVQSHRLKSAWLR